MWLSVIIPGYNSGPTIERLLDSIVAQGDRDIQVVLCDDKSTEPYFDKVKPYESLLNIKYCTTKEHKVKCPGNTRQDGLDQADGEWVTFIDHDDAFEVDAFYIVKNYIQENDIHDLVVTQFREWYPESRMYDEKIHDEMTWMHGKFYNKQFLLDHNIHFEEDLESHEDLFFNSSIYLLYLQDGIDYHFIDRCTYKWIYTPTSLSREWNDTKYNYLERHFTEWLYAAYKPWLEEFKVRPCQEVQIKLFSFTVYAYFYYQGSLWRQSEEGILPGTIESIYDYVDQICNVCNCSVEDIIYAVYNSPQEYRQLKDVCKQGIGDFVEVESYMEFMTTKRDKFIESHKSKILI